MMKKNQPDIFNGSGTQKESSVKCEKIEVINEGENCSETKPTAKGLASSPFKPSFNVLPSELLFKIFQFLPHSDLNSCIEVCSKFRDIGCHPLLWSMFPIPAMEISQDEGLDRLLAVLKLPRFRQLKVLDLNRVYLSHSFKEGKKSVSQSLALTGRSKFLEILTIASELSLSWLDLSYNHLPSLSAPQFLANLVLKIPHVELFATCRKASSNFIATILANLSDDSTLKNLNLGGCDLDTLPVNLVSKFNCVTSLALEGAFMTLEQARVFMTDMAKGTKIKIFNISCEPIVDADTLSDVFENLDVVLVATALNNLEHLSYNKRLEVAEDCCDFPPDIHLASFLEMMGRGTRLKQLDMEENNYFYVPPQVVAKAFNNLERLEMKPNRNNTSAQISAILKMMAENTKVKYLTFDYENLSWLNPGLVARAVVQVEKVVMECVLSKARIRAILGQIDESSIIRHLDLCNNDVSKVPGHILETAVKFLKRGGGSVVLKQVGRKLFLRC